MPDEGGYYARRNLAFQITIYRATEVVLGRVYYLCRGAVLVIVCLFL